VPRIRVRVVVDAPVERVWAAVEDIGSHVEWMADAVAIRFTTSQHAGVGTAFECDTKVGPFRLVDRMVVTSWKPGRELGVDHRGIVSGSGRFTLAPARRGRTRFTWTERLRFPLWLGGPVTAWFASPVLRRIWRRNLRGLQARVEASRAEP
jgi:hypothetical protein